MSRRQKSPELFALPHPPFSNVSENIIKKNKSSMIHLQLRFYRVHSKALLILLLSSHWCTFMYYEVEKSGFVVAHIFLMHIQSRVRKSRVYLAKSFHMVLSFFPFFHKKNLASWEYFTAATLWGVIGDNAHDIISPPVLNWISPLAGCHCT
jgi:hypothetical protein